jgi:hypothetical protein
LGELSLKKPRIKKAGREEAFAAASENIGTESESIIAMSKEPGGILVPRVEK